MKLRIHKNTSKAIDPYYIMYETTPGVWKYVKKQKDGGMYHPVYFYECTNAMSYIRKIESRGGLDENGVILPESEIVKEYNI
jgi:hypothetical protein